MLRRPKHSKNEVVAPKEEYKLLSMRTTSAATLQMVISLYVTVFKIATCYGLDGPGIESRCGEISAPVQTGPGAHPDSCTMGTRSFPGVKRPGRDVDHPPQSSAEIKERVELYFYSPSGPSSPVLG
jgi:hypothetical protein